MNKITKEIIANHNLLPEEYSKIKEILKREPNITELGMYSVLWSEHCSYKSSKPLLKTLPSEGDNIIQGPGENAGIIDIGDGLAIVMKVESHNHPSAIEPYQGAATGVGGIIRDIITMGARPIALLNSLRFGQLQKGKNRHLFTKVVEGIAGYGNCVGIPTVAGEIYFDDCYEGNPLVNVMCVGVLKTDNIVNAVAKGEENSVVYAGAATGKDGVKGASFASKELHDKSEEDLPSVQVGDPFMGKLLIEACMEIASKDYLVAMQDMGAAGLTSSSAEMAYRGNIGMEINLDNIPKREKNISPYEIMLSESQERMLLIVQRGYETKAINIFKKWGLNASIIGKLNKEPFFTVKEKEKVVARVPAESLANPPISKLKAKKPKYIEKIETANKNKLYSKLSNAGDYNKTLKIMLASPNIASKKAVYEQYDHTIGTNTAVLPGKADASVIRIKNTNKAIALTIDGNSRYCYADPFIGGQITVCEAARNIVCTGAKPLAITDGLNFGNPNDPEVFWTFTQSINGIKKAAKELNTPIVSGNVSLYNEKEGKAIYPSPIIGMMGIISDINNITTRAFKNNGDIILLLGNNTDELGVSEYLSIIHKSIGEKPPTVNIKLEKLIQDTCLELINKKLISSAHDISEGGLAITISEACIDNMLGADISLEDKNISAERLLFGESQSRIIISTPPDKIDELVNYLENNKVPHQKIGTVTNAKKLKINEYINIYIDTVKKTMENSLVM